MPQIHDARDDRERATGAAIAALGRGELVVLPTDTVYGVAADAFRPEATRRVFEVKERAASVPLPVLVHSPKQLLGLTPEVAAEAERLMSAYWPGPLTLVVAEQPGMRWELGDARGTIAVRMPLDDISLEVIRGVGPLAVTSANRSGHPPATTVLQAQEQLGDGVAVYVDDGPRTHGPPSTIVDLTRSRPEILRSGALDDADVLAVARGDLAPLEAARRWSDEAQADR